MGFVCRGISVLRPFSCTFPCLIEGRFATLLGLLLLALSAGVPWLSKVDRPEATAVFMGLEDFDVLQSLGAGHFAKVDKVCMPSNYYARIRISPHGYGL